MRAWYLPMWVSRARPLQSPTAYSQPPSTPVARSWSSTSTNLPGSSPTVLEPEVVGARAPAGGDEQLVADELGAVVEVDGDRPVSRRAARG